MLRARAVTLLVARVVLGLVFVVHGWQKVTETGLDGTTKFFESVGIALAALAAPGQALLEIVGGLALILGALLPVFGTLLGLGMIGAIGFVHGANGFSMANNGYEFVLTLAVASLAIGFSGGGALAVDSVWNRRSANQPVEATANA